MQIMKFLSDKFELVRGGGAGNLRAMEGTRGFAVLLVFAVHYATMLHPWMVPASSLEHMAQSLHTVGKTGVDLFFILSGYLIYRSLIVRPQSFVPFMRRRIMRIYPAFIAVFLLYVAISQVSAADNRIPAGLGPATSYLLQNLLLIPALKREEPMIAVTWSLSYEMLFYFIIPFVVGGLALRKRTVPFRLSLFGLLGAAIVAYSFTGGHIRMIMFIAGIFLSEALQHPRVFKLGAVLGALGLALGLAATQLPVGGRAEVQVQMGILFCGFFVFCYMCYSDPKGGLARVFSWTPLRWLGNMSYSYYLLHGVTIKASVMVLEKLLPASVHQSGWVFWGVLPVVLGATLLSSAVLFLTIERPFSLAVPDRALLRSTDLAVALPYRK